MWAINVHYFAFLREKAGLEFESFESSGFTCREIYRQLSLRHGFELPDSMLMVAVNDGFCPMDTVPGPGDKVVFIPPVAGG